MKKLHPKNRLNKIHLVFDEEKRREFLTGFHKRKLERKKQVQEKFEQELKAERRRIKAEAKERYKTFVVSHRDIPELEEVQEECEDDNVKVEVVQLSAHNIAMENNYIGDNHGCNDDTEEEVEEDNVETVNKNEIPGMELKMKKQVSTKQKLKPSVTDSKSIKKLLQKKATKSVQKSKIFQKKNKLENQKQRRKNIKKEHEQERLDKKKKKMRRK